MSVNKKIRKWKKLTDEITSKWIKDYFGLKSVNPDWVADEVGGVFELNDYYFGFDTVLKCYELDIPKDTLFSWYDFRLENGSSNISLERYFLDENGEIQKEILKEMKERVELAKELFLKSLKEFDNNSINK